MKGVCDYAVIYDISCNKERRKIDKLLKGFGFRIQKSVFECRLNKRAKRDLHERLLKIDIRTGFVKIYRLEFSSKRIVIGDSNGQTSDSGNAFII